MPPPQQQTTIHSLHRNLTHFLSKPHTTTPTSTPSPEQGSLLRNLTHALSISSPQRKPTPSNDGGLLRKPTTALQFLRRYSSTTPSVKPDKGVLAQFARLSDEQSFALVRFGDAWYEDIVAIYTNALRFETRALLFILYCVDERREVLEQGDIKSLLAWLKPYARFVTAVMAVLNDVFIPWIEQRADLPQSTPRAYFKEEEEAVTRTLRKVDAYSDKLLGYEAEKAAAKLNDVLGDVGRTVLAFCGNVQGATPTLVQCHFDVEEGVDVSVRMVGALKAKEGWKKNLVLLLRWLRNRPETTHMWRWQYLDLGSYLAYGRWKRPGLSEDCLAYFTQMCRNVPDDYG